MCKPRSRKSKIDVLPPQNMNGELACLRTVSDRRESDVLLWQQTLAKLWWG